MEWAMCREVTVMTLSGECLEGSFDAGDSLRDLAVWIRSLAIPKAILVSVHLEASSWASPLRFSISLRARRSSRMPRCRAPPACAALLLARRLRDAFRGSEEAALTVVRRPYSVREREELFSRLVRSTVAGDLGQLRELLKELER